jgi:hypothetical protein
MHKSDAGHSGAGAATLPTGHRFGDSPMLELRIMTVVCALVGVAPIIYMLVQSA